MSSKSVFKKDQLIEPLIAFFLLMAVFVAGCVHARQDSRDIAAIPGRMALPQDKVTFNNWGLYNTKFDSHIHIQDAWKLEQGSKNVVVAVIDTGLDATHPDLQRNLWKHPIYGYYGWDYVTGKPNPIDDHGHGTHVSGIIGAALNSKVGTAGVSQNVSIMAVKYYSEKNSGSKNLENSIKALNWSIDNGARIINYSGGGPESSKQELQALLRAKEKGILVVAAAGNDRQNTDIEENHYYPCAYRLDNIICVAAINIRNQLLVNSNWGKRLVDVAAPGEDILSTAPLNKGKYARMSGTSQATAFVTGLGALLLARDSTLKPAQIKEIIRSSVDVLSSIKDKVLAGGKVNAFRALAQLDKRLDQKLPKPAAVLAAVKKTSPTKTKSVVPAAKATASVPATPPTAKAPVFKSKITVNDSILHRPSNRSSSGLYLEN